MLRWASSTRPRLCRSAPQFFLVCSPSATSDSSTSTNTTTETTSTTTNSPHKHPLSSTTTTTTSSHQQNSHHQIKQKNNKNKNNDQKQQQPQQVSPCLVVAASPQHVSCRRCFSTTTLRRVSYGGGGGGGGNSSGMRGVELRDEEELVKVLGAQPRHVARRVRQMMATSRRRLSHFRNTVTYLMIVLQGKLQKQEITPADAAVVVEGILQECVDLGQSDMAHLLFRAALRFRKYGVKVSTTCVHALYQSFRDSSASYHQQQQQKQGKSSPSPPPPETPSSAGGESRRGLLAQLATEMKEQDDLKALTIAAFIYAGQVAEAQALHKSIPTSEMTHEAYCTMIEAYSNTGNFAQVEELVAEVGKLGDVLDEDDRGAAAADDDDSAAEKDANRGNSTKKNKFDTAAIYSTAIVCARMNSKAQDAFLTDCIQNACKPSDAAIAAVMRNRLSNCKSLDEAILVESDLREQLKTDQLGLAATTAFVLRCADFVGNKAASGDKTMLAKIEQLADIVNLCIENGETDRIDPSYAIALVRGFGALGHFGRMWESLNILKKHTMLVDFRIYDECLRWLSYAGNVKEMLEIKEAMEKEHVYHSAWTYVSLLRGLGKFYPRLTHKYVEEARKNLPFFDERMYAQVIQSYSALGEVDKIKTVYQEMLDRDSRGRRCFNNFSVTQLLFSLCHSDRKLFDEIVTLAHRRGLFTYENVQRAIIVGYAQQRRRVELQQFVSQLPRKSFQIYISLVSAYGTLDDTNGFDKLLDEMKASQVPFNDTFFSVAAEVCAKWRDSKRFQRMVEISTGAAQASKAGYITAKDPRIMARIAGAHSQMNDWDTVCAIWQDIKNTSAGINDGEQQQHQQDGSSSATTTEKATTTTERTTKNTTVIPMMVFNKFLEMSVKHNDLALAQDILEVMMARVPPNPVTTTTVMDMLARMGRLHEVEVLLDEMCNTKNIQPTIVTFHHALTAFAKVGDIAKLLALRDKLRSTGLQESAITHNIILSGYGKAQRFESIPELLNERAAYGIPVDTNCYEILLDIYAKARMANELENTVQAMLKEPLVVLDGGDDASGDGSGDGTSSARRGNGLLAATDSAATPRLLAAIATAYSHLGDVANVEKFVSLLLAHKKCRQTHIETTFLIYHRLRDNAKLDWLLAKYGGSEFILNVCISAFAKAGMHERVSSILQELQTKKMALHSNTAVVLSSLLLKAGKVELAQTVLRFRRVAAARYLRRGGGGGGGEPESTTTTAGGKKRSPSLAAAAAVDGSGKLGADVDVVAAAGAGATASDDEDAFESS